MLLSLPKYLPLPSSNGMGNCLNGAAHLDGQFVVHGLALIPQFVMAITLNAHLAGHRRQSCARHIEAMTICLLLILSHSHTSFHVHTASYLFVLPARSSPPDRFRSPIISPFDRHMTYIYTYSRCCASCGRGPAECISQPRLHEREAPASSAVASVYNFRRPPKFCYLYLQGRFRVSKVSP